MSNYDNVSYVVVERMLKLISTILKQYPCLNLYLILEKVVFFCHSIK